MLSEQAHKMKLEFTHPSGAEEWSCPECGRRFIAQWEPAFRRVILEHGQEDMIHVGQGMGFQGQEPGGPGGDHPEDGPELGDVWKKWLDQMDFDL